MRWVNSMKLAWQLEHTWIQVSKRKENQKKRQHFPLWNKPERVWKQIMRWVNSMKLAWQFELLDPIIKMFCWQRRKKTTAFPPPKQQHFPLKNQPRVLFEDFDPSVQKLCWEKRGGRKKRRGKKRQHFPLRNQPKEYENRSLDGLSQWDCPDNSNYPC